MPCCDSVLMNIPGVTETSVIKLIKSSTAKSCPLDPIPNSMIKKYAASVAKQISKIINKSLSSGEVPRILKEALVRPLLKKDSLDPELMKNYRPVSNLPYLSKLLEKHADFHFTAYDNVHGIIDPNQSAYTSNCSTETSLLRVWTDILLAVDSAKAVVLTMLDLSAAFDTIDHQILLNRLHDCYGFRGTALRWMQSYLSGRFQSVLIGNVTSQSKELLYGVPREGRNLSNR